MCAVRISPSFDKMPGNDKVDEEVDKLEAAIENSEIPEDDIVRWNIKYVMRRFRHQPLLDPRLDADDHKHRGPVDMTKDDQFKLGDSFVQNFVHPAGCKIVWHGNGRLTCGGVFQGQFAAHSLTKFTHANGIIEHQFDTRSSQLPFFSFATSSNHKIN